MPKLELEVQKALGKTQHYLIKTKDDKELRNKFNCKYIIFDFNGSIVGLYDNLEHILQDYK